MHVEFNLPELGHNLETGEVVTVLVREGDVVSKGTCVAEVETEKAVVEIFCTFVGHVAKVHIIKGQNVRVGQLVLTIETEESVMESQEKQKTTEEDASKDMEKKEEATMTEPESKNEPSPGIPAQRGTREPSVPPGELGQDIFGPVRREFVSPTRLAFAAQMVRAVSTIPHVTNYDDADVTDLERMRKTIPPAYLGPTVKLTAMPFVLKSVAMALRQHTPLNATYDEQAGQMVFKQYINFGVSVETPRGLLTPVLRNVDQMSILQIARELTLLGARARSADFKPEELQGGTFTISNLGVVGGVYSTPIIQPPEVAILLVGRSRWLLGVHEGKIEGRLMMPFSLSYDARAVDSAVAGRFLNDVIDLLQAPGKLMMTR
jgi:pyruvate dehydrogenase E2 component (dihydrolipoamide acetyltransferase)